MKILWFTWKDMTHPWAGGAELVNERLAERLAADGHEVILLVGGYPNCKPHETINGYKVIRVGGFYSVFWHAFRYYRNNLRDWPDLIIEEMNTLPFFTRFYAKQTKVLFYHQLCREVWLYQMKKPFCYIGYLAEPIYLQFLRGMKAITISESSKQDLSRFGFNKDDITVVRVGIDLEPLASIDFSYRFTEPTLLSLGALRPMKRTLDQVEAFEIAKQRIPALQLILAGDAQGEYGETVLEYIKDSKFSSDIRYVGKVSSGERLNLMQCSHLLLATSVKEGWGLTVTEAASQGTPAVTYDVDGLRDSTNGGTTGIIAACNSPQGLAKAIALALNNKKSYRAMCNLALKASYQYNFDTAYSDFKITLAALPITGSPSFRSNNDELSPASQEYIND